jgi:hypothetical protein
MGYFEPPMGAGQVFGLTIRNLELLQTTISIYSLPPRSGML